MHLTPAGHDLVGRVCVLHRNVGIDVANVTVEDAPLLERALTTIDAVVLKRLRRLR